MAELVDDTTTPEFIMEVTIDLFYALGYNSSGKPPYFENMEEEKLQMEEYNEPSLTNEEEPTIISRTSPGTGKVDTSVPHFVMISSSKINKMMADTLKKELR